MADQSASRPVTESTRRRWLRSSLILVLVFLGPPAGYFLYVTWSLRTAIARVIAETDALDARWHFEDIEADRKSYRDEENSALQVIKVAALIGKRHPQLPTSHKHYEQVFKKLPSSMQLNVQQIETIRESFEKIPEALVEGRKLKDLPNGRFALTPATDGFSLLLPNQPDARLICDLLQHDAMLRAQQGDVDGALESSMALLNAARSLEDDPLVAVMLLRLVGDAMLVRAVERTLAQGYANGAPMKELQNRIRRERDDLHAHWITVVRGDRALHHKFFTAVHAGKLLVGQHMQKNLHMNIGFQDRLANYWPALYTKRYPEDLRYRNELVAAAQLPLEKQFDQFTALAKKVSRGEHGQAVTLEFVPLLPPDLSRSCDLYRLGHATLGATEAGLACERFRRMHERWPESVEELVKTGMLVAIPSDPYNGLPLRLARLKDGLAVYSVGRDMQDNGGKDLTDAWGADPGFRLWDPDKRRQPPRPPVALDK